MKTDNCSCSRSRLIPCPVPPSHPVPTQREALLIYPHLLPLMPPTEAEKIGSSFDVNTIDSCVCSSHSR